MIEFDVTHLYVLPPSGEGLLPSWMKAPSFLAKLAEAAGSTPLPLEDESTYIAFECENAAPLSELAELEKKLNQIVIDQGTLFLFKSIYEEALEGLLTEFVDISPISQLQSIITITGGALGKTYLKGISCPSCHATQFMLQQEDNTRICLSCGEEYHD